MSSYFHSGDFGDVISSLPILRQHGGGDLFLGPHRSNVPHQRPRTRMDRAAFDLIQPLVAAQDYVKSVEWSPDSKQTDYDLSNFRCMGWNRQDNLGEWQARWIKCLPLDMSPWLNVESTLNGRIVITRSPRYLNPEFPWKKICDTYGDRILFVGLPTEHQDLQAKFGVAVEHAQTKDLLEVAQVIAGAELQFANQSAPFWIGAGLGKIVIQETCLPIPNSIINRDELMYSRNPEELRAIHHFLDAEVREPAYAI